ncbi:MAG TPA: S41 family peptidase [Aeromicrobium sp.]|nr:S41 family peptidase [Aeromicrobium sp.]
MSDPDVLPPQPDHAGEAHDQADTAGRPAGRGPRFESILALLLVAAIGGGGLFVSGFMLGRLNGATPGTGDEQQELFRPFWDAYNDVSTRYVGEVDQHALIEGAIKGIFQALNDPFSAYMTEEEYRASLSGISGEFEGIGLSMATVEENGDPCETVSATCRLIAQGVIRNSPALEAGFLEGDIVLAVDGESTIGQTLTAVVDKVRGPKGTSVVLTIERAGGPPQDISVTRDVIVREDVRSEAIANGHVGYIKVDGFSSGSAADLRAQVQALLEEDGVEALVLDLRDDPGGYVDAAQKIGSEFVGTGPLYWEQAAGTDPVPQQPTAGGVATDPAVPMAVLVNGGTASASEIVAGALQGSGRAFLVGETTYGKGTIQEFKELPGSGGYRLSVRKWLTPDQTWIHGVGLIPDIAVLAPADPATGGDPILDRAVEELLSRLAQPVVGLAA